MQRQQGRFEQNEDPEQMHEFRKSLQIGTPNAK